MKIVIDMNLSPQWVPFLSKIGISASHWSEIGNPCASDEEIMDWARKNGFVVFTNDLDFSRLLALTHDKGPSVIQGRAQNVMPGHIGAIVAHILKRYQKEIEQGALLSFDENKARTRILPL